MLMKAAKLAADTVGCDVLPSGLVIGFPWMTEVSQYLPALSQQDFGAIRQKIHHSGDSHPPESSMKG